MTDPDPDATQAFPAEPPPEPPSPGPEADIPTTWVPPVDPPTAVIPPTPPAPPEEPPVPAPQGDEPPPGNGKSKVGLIVGLVVVVALVIGVVAFLLTADPAKDPADDAVPITLEAAADPGPDPFTPDASEPVDAARANELGGNDPDNESSSDDTSDPAVTNTRSGTDPGLYGGVIDESSCDRGRIARDLASAPSKEGAWAAVAGVPVAEVEQYLATLTPAILLHDTRITDQQFSGGRAVPVQAVLQAGTVVLVGDRGLPLVRCVSGSPLLDPFQTALPVTYEGNQWSGFDPEAVIAVEDSRSVDVFVLIDMTSGQPFSRPVGTDGSEDSPINGSTTTSTSTSTSTSTTTSTSTSTSTTSTTSTTTPPSAEDVSADGSVTASSVFAAATGPELAIDGIASTSWFGTGSDAEPDGSTFTWEVGDTLEIERITIKGNGSQADTAWRTDTGFDSVTVEILDNGTVAYSETFGLPGTPDPTINARPGATGDTIRLIFTGAENPTIGGFSELTVMALR